MPLHPHSQAFIDMIAQSDAPGWEAMTPQQGREVFASLEPLFGDAPELATVEDLNLGGVNCRLYRDHDEIAPVVMFFHGGGFVLGNLDTHDAMCRRIAKQSRMVVISVDYGLSPENRFSGPLDDCYNATVDVVAKAEQINADSDRIIVAGDSAGGNLAACVALRARNQQGPKLAGQVLIYPVIEPRFDTESYSAFATDHGLTRDTMKWFWQQYLGDHQPTELAAPSMAESLADLPPTSIITAEFDVLRDEGERFASQLKDAGVPVSLKRYDGMLHGFIHFAGHFDLGIEATHALSQQLRETFS